MSKLCRPRVAIFLVTVCSIAGALVAPGVVSIATAQYVWEHELFGSGIRDLAYEDGTLWWATSAGLVEWADSETYRVYRRSERALPSDSLNAVAFDGDGNLWCGTDNDGVAIKLATGGWTRVSTFDGLPSSRVLSIARAGGNMFVGTDQGFAEFAAPDQVRGSCTVIDPCVDLFPSLSILAIDVNGATTWFGTAAGPVRSIGDSYEEVSDGLSGGAVNDILHVDGTTWLASDSGAYWLDDRTDTWVPTSGLTREVTALAATSYGLLAASGPLYLWTGTEWERFGPGLNPAAAPVSIVETDAAAIVAGTGRGSYTFAGDVWGGLTQIAGIPDPSGIWGLAVGADSVWVSYRFRSAAAVLGDAGWHPITSSTSGGGFEQATVQGIHIDASGNVWFGHCCCNSNDEIDDCQVDIATPSPDDLAFNRRIKAINIRSFVTIGDEVAFMGSGAEDNTVSGAGLFVWTDALAPDSAAVFTATNSPISSNTIPALALGTDGDLWIGHRQNGLDVWDYGLDPLDGSGDTWTHYDEDAGDVDRFIISNDVLSLAADGDRVWAGTAGGVSLYENRAHRGSWGASTLGNPLVTALVVTADRSAWAGTPSGLVRFRPNSLGTFDTERYDFPDLNNNRIFSLAAKGNDIWVGTTRGLSHGRPSQGPGGTGSPLLGSAYPNPFDPSRHDGVRFVDVTDVVTGEVFDVTGLRVSTFTDVEPGDIVWGGGTDAEPHSPVAPGLYVIVARADERVLTARVAVIR